MAYRGGRKLRATFWQNVFRPRLRHLTGPDREAFSELLQGLDKELDPMANRDEYVECCEIVFEPTSLWLKLRKWLS